MNKPKFYYNAFLFSTRLFIQLLFGIKKPLIATWSLTNRCNLDCKYCGLPSLPHQELSKDKLLDLLDSAHQSGVRLISITGGEPLLSPYFLDFVSAAFQKNILLSLNSNGQAIAKNIALVKKYFYKITISLDGPPEINDPLRGRGSALKALKTIQLLRQQKIRHSVTCVVTSNLSRLAQTVQFSLDNDIPLYYQIVFDKDLGNLKEHSLKLSTDEKLALINQLIQLKKKHPKHVLNTQKSLKLLHKHCLKPKKLMCHGGGVFFRVEPNGDIRKCSRVEYTVAHAQIGSNGLEECFLALERTPDCSSCYVHGSLALGFKNGH